MLLTIGMATYDDFDGVYFSLQALKAYHDLEDVELVVVDTKPESCKDTANVCTALGAKYYHRPDKVGTSASRNHVFEVANGKFVMCIDCHVLLAKDSVKKLKEYIRQNPTSNNLLQGPLLYDDQRSISTHFDPQWRGQMYGTWGTDQRYLMLQEFDIPMQGLGLFCMRKAVWPKFNKHFRGFGGEEGYIQEKVRQNGGRSLCLSWLKWIHRFSRPKGVPYPLQLKDRIVNYLIGWTELGWNHMEVLEFFKSTLQPQQLGEILKEFTDICGLGIVASPSIENPAKKVAYILDSEDSDTFKNLNVVFPKISIASKSVKDAIDEFSKSEYEYCLIVNQNETIDEKNIKKIYEWTILNQRQVEIASLKEKELNSTKRKHPALSYRIAEDSEINKPASFIVSKNFAALIIKEQQYENFSLITNKYNIKPFTMINPEIPYKFNPHVTPLDNVPGELEFGDIREIVWAAKDRWCLEISSYGLQSTLALCQRGKGIVRVDDYSVIKADALKLALDPFGYANYILAGYGEDVSAPDEGKRLFLINYKNLSENMKYFAYEKQVSFLRKDDIVVLLFADKEIVDVYSQLNEYKVEHMSNSCLIATKT